MVTSLPLANSVWRSARWLIVAPHPDDETLGVGALIAQAARDGRLGGVVYLSDGTGSHPPGTAGLAGARRREAAHALRRLTGGNVPIDHLGWKDARPHAPGSRAFDRDAQRVAVWLRRRGIDAVAVTAVDEHHCDHVAAHHLAAAAIEASRRSVALFSYHVWSEPPAGAIRRYRTASLPPGRRLHALRAHRSQLSPFFGDGFRLDPTKQRMAAIDILSMRRAAS